MVSAPTALRRNPLRTAQIALAVLSLALSAAILGTAADAYKTYKSQSTAMNPWWLPLWPQHFDTRSTPTIIGTAAAVLVLNLVFLVIALVPRIQIMQSPKLAAMITAAVSVPSFLLALIGIIFARVLNSRSGGSTDRDTIQTWTCRFRNSQPVASNLGINPKMSNERFGKLCDESLFSFYGLIPLILLQFAMIVIAIIGWRQPVLTLPRSSGSTKEVESSPSSEPSSRGS